jgi:hypothetical protein
VIVKGIRSAGKQRAPLDGSALEGILIHRSSSGLGRNAHDARRPGRPYPADVMQGCGVTADMKGIQEKGAYERPGGTFRDRAHDGVVRLLLRGITHAPGNGPGRHEIRRHRSVGDAQGERIRVYTRARALYRCPQCLLNAEPDRPFRCFGRMPPSRDPDLHLEIETSRERKTGPGGPFTPDAPGPREDSRKKRSAARAHCCGSGGGIALVAQYVPDNIGEFPGTASWTSAAAHLQARHLHTEFHDKFHRPQACGGPYEYAERRESPVPGRTGEAK